MPYWLSCPSYCFLVSNICSWWSHKYEHKNHAKGRFTKSLSFLFSWSKSPFFLFLLLKKNVSHWNICRAACCPIASVSTSVSRQKDGGPPGSTSEPMWAHFDQMLQPSSTRSNHQHVTAAADPERGGGQLAPRLTAPLTPRVGAGGCFQGNGDWVRERCGCASAPVCEGRPAAPAAITAIFSSRTNDCYWRRVVPKEPGGDEIPSGASVRCVCVRRRRMARELTYLICGSPNRQRGKLHRTSTEPPWRMAFIS